MFDGECASARCDFGTELLQSLVCLVQANGQHIEVLVPFGATFRGDECSGAAGGRHVLEEAGGVEGGGEGNVELLAAFHSHFAPDEFLHALLGFYPRAAGVAPSGTTGSGYLHTERIGKGDGITEGILPFRRHVGEAFLHHLRCGHAGIEVVIAAYADTVHPFDILADAVFGDVAIHPVPPHARTSLLRWSLETLEQVLCKE